MHWEPHTSSIDFCESNYSHFDRVVEFHNSWSSLVGVAALGLIGALWNNPTREIRTVLAYLTLFLIGIGSAELHCSLHWIFQASDSLSGFWRGITPHVLWHFTAAFGTHCAIACAVVCRMEALQIPFRLEHLGGIIPITVLIDDNKRKSR